MNVQKENDVEYDVSSQSSFSSEHLDITDQGHDVHTKKNYKGGGYMARHEQATYTCGGWASLLTTNW